MTIYLTKSDGDQMDHFRVAIEPNGISIVAGRCYHYLLSLFHGIGLPASQVTEKDKRRIREMADEFVQRQIEEGYVITPFVETKENTVQVYDNARFHYEGNFPEDLGIHQAHVHTGFYLGWLIERGLINEEYFAEYAPALQAFRNREMTGPALYEQLLSGELAIEMLSEEGNRFTLSYFDFVDGQYVHDYRHTLARFESSVYHVEDSWENYVAIRAVIDQRYATWQDQAAIAAAPEIETTPPAAVRRPWWKLF